MKIKTFHFTVVLQGEGTNEAEAWRDACESLAQAPGFPDKTVEVDGHGCELDKARKAVK